MAPRNVVFSSMTPQQVHASAGHPGTLIGKSGSVSHGVTAPFSWILVHTSFFCTLQESGPRSCGSSVIKSHWPSKSSSLGIFSPFAGSQVEKSALGLRPFAASVNFFGITLLQCGSSAQWLCGWANGTLLQEDLSHMLCLPGLLLPEPLSPQQATADPCLRRRHSNTQRWV